MNCTVSIDTGNGSGPQGHLLGKRGRLSIAYSMYLGALIGGSGYAYLREGTR